LTEFVESLSGSLTEIGIDFTKEQLDQSQKYHDLLLEWNSKMNLTSIKEPREIAIKHFTDSVISLKYINIKRDERLIDVGTGAGFPGLPIKIFFPEIRLVLLDSLAKRCAFLEKIKDSLGLKNVLVIQGRAEDKGKDPEFREKFTLVTARAVTNLSVLAEYCLPFLKVNGCFFALKGPEVLEEVEKGKNAIITMGGSVKEVKHYKLPFLGDSRSLVLVEKKKPTPEKYPRKAGIPGKNPIC